MQLLRKASRLLSHQPEVPSQLPILIKHRTSLLIQQLATAAGSPAHQLKLMALLTNLQVPAAAGSCAGSTDAVEVAPGSQAAGPAQGCQGSTGVLAHVPGAAMLRVLARCRHHDPGVITFLTPG